MARKSSVKTAKASVTVSIPRAGEFVVAIPITLTPSSSEISIQRYCNAVVLDRIAVKVTNMDDLAKWVKEQAKDRGAIVKGFRRSKK